MKYQNKKKAVLLLEDGTHYEGYSVGKEGTTTGEICFNTGMTGYQEIYTDPSYSGQIIINTTSHIGNYGVHTDEVESNSVKFSGLVCKSFSNVASRLDADSDLQTYLEVAGVVGISDVDTRAIVRYIRDKGAMNALVSSEDKSLEDLKSELSEVPSMAGLELASKVSTESTYLMGEDSAEIKVAVLDLGAKLNILRNLESRGVQLKVFPAQSSFEDMSAWGADAYFLSNGPGDPSATTYAIDTAKKMIDSHKPVFGICLGHQILALANGISTYKMHNGHRGINHPVKNLKSGKSEVTSQNHGFTVSREDVENHPDIEITHVNLNDDTVEGIRMTNKKVFSVQHHPEAAPGPLDASYIFDEFIDLIKK